MTRQPNDGDATDHGRTNDSGQTDDRTDHDDTTMTDTSDTTTRDRRTASKPTRDDGQPMKVKDMDHTPPVEGTRRVFERDNEGRPARADGGQRPADETTETGADEEDEDADDGRYRQKMKDMDHTPPVEGPNRTFERGNENVVEE